MKETLSKRLMIYGAYGFTGKLTVELALSKKIDFIAAGRRKESLEKLQKQLNQTFEIRAFDLKDADANLLDVGVVLHCAGPFTYTSKPMVDACLAAKAHYLDITGEIPVFEQLADRDEEAKKAGIVLVPGAGFDVVPSDLLGAHLHKALPDATNLEIYMDGAAGTPSIGTTKTMIEYMDKPTLCRRDGKLVPSTQSSKTISFLPKGREATGAPVSWGDVATAYRTTGIKNIDTFFLLPYVRAKMMTILPMAAKIPGVKWAFTKLVDTFYPSGPQAEARSKSRALYAGRVYNEKEEITGWIETYEAYEFTAAASLHLAVRALEGKLEQKSGYATPTMAFGTDLHKELEDLNLHLNEKQTRTEEK